MTIYWINCFVVSLTLEAFQRGKKSKWNSILGINKKWNSTPWVYIQNCPCLHHSVQLVYKQDSGLHERSLPGVLMLWRWGWQTWASDNQALKCQWPTVNSALRSNSLGVNNLQSKRSKSQSTQRCAAVSGRSVPPVICALIGRICKSY